ncbi:MAG: putative Ig domain-containing protein, partial [Verrucomicrobia bacterium]|nr:putative Ig domain-containing protein [Verrucomicrobiota bacterium]
MLPCLAQDPKVWQIGVENVPPSSDEFGVHTGANEAPPGALGVMDDDFYTQGTYPSGFNGLTSQRVLSADEASTQWERSLTPGDRTNRVHFVLSSAQVSTDSRGRLTIGLFNGNITSNSVNLGFGEHIIVANFRNAAGVVRQISSNVVTAEAKLVATFSMSYVQAAAGPNTIEIIRLGPNISGTSQYIRFDHVTVEADAGGNTPPVAVAVPTQTIPESAPFNLVLQTTDTDTPANEIIYSPLSIPSGLTFQSTGNIIWTPSETQGGASYTVTYRMTDDGIPKMMATNSFTIVVSEINRPPTTTTISGTQTINEGSAFSINVAAADPDLPAQTLAYSVASAPAGLGVSPAGLVTWTPTEAQGPSTNVVSIRITDSGVPPLSVTNNFTVRVLEVGTAPTLTDVPAQSASEGTTFTYSLTASDPDVPVNTFTFAKVSGPSALTVAANGVVTWNIQEADAPSTSTVVVKVTDNGSPTRSHTNQFSLTANEVNLAPVIPAIANQIVTPAAPLDLQLIATDPDLPANSLTFERISGPTGLTISPAGLAVWTPTPAQIPSTSTVVFRVTDNGIPNRSTTNQFTVITESVQARYVWQIGDIEPANSTAMDEFSSHNNNTLPPGSVWRRSGDPAYSASTTYVADDDHYMAGVYPQGFNGLTAPLTVTLDEDTRGWERNLTGSDRTNRLHLILTQDQIIGASAFRVTYEITSGWTNNGGPALGFGSHPLVVRFRNGNGVTTTLSSRTVTTAETTITFVFSATNVQATLGPNTLEWVSNVPQPTGTSSGATFDYVLIEAEASGNPAPVPVGVGTPNIDEMVAYSLTLNATDASVPAQQLTYTVISGPAGLTVSPAGALNWTPS